jgi:hypothetical protein
MIGVRKGRRALFCTYCNGEMHPKRIRVTGTPFFAHNPGHSCPFAGGPGESMEHLALKDRLYVAIRDVPRWKADLEVPGVDPLTGEHYAIDVAAFPEDDRKAPWAYEVQLARQTEAETLRRTAQRERGHLARVVWINDRARDWSTRFPSVMVDDDHRTVIDGVFVAEEVRADPMPVESVIGGFLRDRLWWVEHVGFIDRRTFFGPPTRRPAPTAQRGGRTVDDYCDRAPSAARQVEAIEASGLRPFWVDWGEDELFCYATTAHARKAAGSPLTMLDREVIARYPTPPSIYDPLPSQRADESSPAA